MPLPRVAGREPPVRFALEHGDARKDLPHLRSWWPRSAGSGEKGMTVTRFKGLGEMDPEELWETTLDPAQRTLLQVTLNDAAQGGGDVPHADGRGGGGPQQFIMKRSITNLEEIDYGA